MPSVGKLFVEFEASMSAWNKQLKSMAKETKEFEKALKPTKDLAQSLGKGMALVGGAIVGAIGGMVKQAADYGDAIRDASIRTGIATDQIGILKYTAEQSGLSFEGLQVGLKKFAVNIHEAATGSKAQIAVFASMGIQVKDAQGKMLPLTAALGKVSDRFNAMPDGIEKTALAVELFGRNGTEMIEFLSLGSAAMREFEARARRLGLAIGPDAAKQADDFKDALADMKAALLGLSIAVGRSLLPALTSIAVRIANLVAGVRDFAETHQGLVEALTIVGGLVAFIGSGLYGMFEIIPKLRAAWLALNAVMAANPILFAATVITAATVAIIVYRREIVSFLVDVLIPVLDAIGKVSLSARIMAERLKDVRLVMDIEDSLEKSGAGVDNYRSKYDKLAASMGKIGKTAKEMVHELPYVLPWFMRLNPAAAFEGAGGLGSFASGAGSFSSAAASIPGGSRGSGGPSIAVTHTYAPRFHFDGVPADAEKFHREKLMPILKKDFEQNTRGLTKGLMSALRTHGMESRG